MASTRREMMFKKVGCYKRRPQVVFILAEKAKKMKKTVGENVSKRSSKPTVGKSKNTIATTKPYFWCAG